MRITFHGAACNVTGAKHLIEYNGKRILLDCGFFQGRRREAREKNSSLPFDPKSIDAVVLSHAHLDHCGMLPVLVKGGFRGIIYCTPATKDVMRAMLMDAAYIQEHDYQYLLEKGVPDSEELAKPLYTPSDIPRVMRRCTTLPYVRNGGRFVEILPGVEVKFYDAGHILGSAVSVLRFQKEGGNTCVGYTGDLGRDNSSLLYDPQPIREKVPVMISECTYGSRRHESQEKAFAYMKEIVRTIARTKGKLIIPAFALGRTQEIVYALHKLTDDGDIPRIPIFVDSPLARRVTTIFKRYRDDYDIESRLDFPRLGDVPLFFRNLTYVETRDESMRLNAMQGPLVIISASGMAEGGRVLHHLKHSIRSRKNIILFTGYQAQNTLGRRILEGVSPVRIFGRRYPVRARIEVVNELSAHADGREVAEYLERVQGVERVFLVHGEEKGARSLKRLLRRRSTEWDVVIPCQGDQWEI